MPLRGRIESICHPWTTSPCILRVAGSLRSARSGSPLQGRSLRFIAGGALICASTTDASGRASCYGVAPSGEQIARSGYRIVFDGDGRLAAGSAEATTVVTIGSDPRSSEGL